jgi:hypothetical protein
MHTSEKSKEALTHNSDDESMQAPKPGPTLSFASSLSAIVNEADAAIRAEAAAMHRSGVATTSQGSLEGTRTQGQGKERKPPRRVKKNAKQVVDDGNQSDQHTSNSAGTPSARRPRKSVQQRAQNMDEDMEEDIMEEGDDDATPRASTSRAQATSAKRPKRSGAAASKDDEEYMQDEDEDMLGEFGEVYSPRVAGGGSSKKSTRAAGGDSGSKTSKFVSQVRIMVCGAWLSGIDGWQIQSLSVSLMFLCIHACM